MQRALRRGQANRFGQGLGGSVDLAGSVQRGGQVDPGVHRIRAHLDRLAPACERRLGLAAAREHDAEIVAGVEMAGVGFEGLAIQRGGALKVAGAVLAQPVLERIRNRHGRLMRRAAGPGRG